jgi:hypothetical protein
MSSVFPIITATMPAAAEFMPVVLIGILFGVALEVAGFGNSKNLAAQFYFHDMRVFKVMFTAIVTASTGAALFAALGLLNIDLVYVPDTFIVPLMVGGFILGMGFMISSYCPGTSIVGAASGKIDGIVTFLGVIIGAVVFGMIQPHVEGFYMSTAKGVLTLPKLLGIPFQIISLTVAVGAFLLFLGADRLEGIFAGKLGMPQGVGMSGAARKTLGAVIAVGVLAVVFQYSLSPEGTAMAAGKTASVTPIELAQMIVNDPRSLYVVDLRGGGACKGAENIPAAACFADVKDNLEFMYKGKTMVVFSEDGKKPLPEALYKFPGRLVSLEGGYDAWRTMIIGKPEPAYQAFVNAADPGRRNMISALHSYFTGAKMEAPAPSAAPGGGVVKPKKRSGGCS